MALFTLNTLNYIVAGKTSRIVSLNYKDKDGLQHNNVLFVAGVNQDMSYTPNSLINDSSNFQQCNNVFSLYNVENGEIVHPLFDVKDLCFKSYVQKYLDISEDVDLSKQYIDIYAPQISNTIGCTQLSGSIFMLNGETDSYVGIHKIFDDINSTSTLEVQDVEYNFQIVEDKLSTITYNNVSSIYSLSTIFDPGKVFTGFKYNTIIEIPTMFSYCNDFKNGNVFGNFIYCKNYYDALYSTELTESKNALSSTRRYVGSFTCGNKVYLKFFDTKNYTSNASTNNKLIPISDQTSSKDKCICQRIESFDKQSMYRNNIRHRSNVFSIDIQNTGLTNDTDSKIAQLKKCIQQDIMNNIRQLAQKICPAHTQLFNVKIKS